MNSENSGQPENASAPDVAARAGDRGGRCAGFTRGVLGHDYQAPSDTPAVCRQYLKIVFE